MRRLFFTSSSHLRGNYYSHATQITATATTIPSPSSSSSSSSSSTPIHSSSSLHHLLHRKVPVSIVKQSKRLFSSNSNNSNNNNNKDNSPNNDDHKIIEKGKNENPEDAISRDKKDLDLEQHSPLPSKNVSTHSSTISEPLSSPELPRNSVPIKSEPSPNSLSSSTPTPTPASLHTQTTAATTPSTSRYNAFGQKIVSNFHFAEQKYEEYEKYFMQRIRENNQRRFRMYFFGSIGLITLITVVFGTRIRKGVTEQTAAIAKETLENESLKIQTQELAMAVVQTVLNDKEITAHAATFLKEASNTPETQKALLDLTLHVLQHQQTVDELVILGKRLIHNLTNDKQVIRELSDAFIEVLQDKSLQDVTVKVMGQMVQDPEFVKAVMEMLITVSKTPELQAALVNLGSKASTDVLEDKEILAQSRQFVADVMGDDLLQKEGGNALINTIYHALKPGMIRMVGAGVLALSITTLKLFLSPF